MTIGIDDLYFRTWDHTLKLITRIASLQLQNSDESHRCYEIVKACRGSSLKLPNFEISLCRRVVDTHFRFIDLDRAIGRGGEKIQEKIDTPKPVSETPQTFPLLRPILRLIAALSREEHCSEKHGRDFRDMVISMSQNSRSSSLDFVRGITNGVHGDHVARMKRERKKASMVVGSNLTYGTSSSTPST